jgi:hypothetical protein
MKKEFAKVLLIRIFVPFWMIDILITIMLTSDNYTVVRTNAIKYSRDIRLIII